MSLMFDCQISIKKYVFYKSSRLVTYVTFYSVPMCIRTFYNIEYTTFTTHFEIYSVCVCTKFNDNVFV